MIVVIFELKTFHEYLLPVKVAIPGDFVVDPSIIQRTREPWRGFDEKVAGQDEGVLFGSRQRDDYVRSL